MPLILFLLSFLVLTLQVLETRIFAYSLADNLHFLVVGVTLLGFGAGGTVLSLRGDLGDARPLVRRNLFATAVLLVLAHGWFALFSDKLQFALPSIDPSRIAHLRDAVGQVGPLLVTLSIVVLLASPYFTAGMAISAILAEARGSVHRRYGVHLLGAALGCVPVFLILGPLTGPECLAACAIACGVLGAFLCRQKVTALLVVVLLGAPVFVYSNRILPYQTRPMPGQLALIHQNARTIGQRDDIQRIAVVPKFDRWDPTARVQVHGIEVETSNARFREELTQLPSAWFTRDSSYGSPLIGSGLSPEGTRGVFERTCYAAGYFRGKPKSSVLVIGLGGAPDIQTALHHGVEVVHGVDMNRSAVAMVQGPMAKFLGDPYRDPRVRLHVGDGRTFVRACQRKFDLIQLSGDTRSALASGTLALSESHLYTREAFGDYLRHLEDGGVLCVLLCGEDLRDRLAVTAMAVLRGEFGSTQPHQHLLMAEQSKVFCFLVKRTPFTAEECKKFDAWLVQCDSAGKVDAAGKPVLDGKTDLALHAYELLTPHLSLNNAPRALYVPDGRDTGVVLMQKARAGEQILADHLASRPVDLRPAPDSRPFFFNTVRNESVWQHGPDSGHIWQTFYLLAIMLGLAVVCITVPTLVFGARASGGDPDRAPGLGEQLVQPLRGLLSGLGATVRNLPFACYFAALGVGFVLAVCGLNQRYVLFLGHQDYAFPVVIGGLLVAAALGSMLAGLFRRRPHVCVALAVPIICGGLAGIHFGLDRVFHETAELELLPRIGMALLVLLPLGVPLGMMLPTGLAVAKQNSPVFVPWAFGIHGVFSVIGSTLVLPGAILFGFPALRVAAGGVYLFAGILGFVLARGAARRAAGSGAPSPEPTA